MCSAIVGNVFFEFFQICGEVNRVLYFFQVLRIVTCTKISLNVSWSMLVWGINNFPALGLDKSIEFFPLWSKVVTGGNCCSPDTDWNSLSLGENSILFVVKRVDSACSSVNTVCVIWSNHRLGKRFCDLALHAETELHGKDIYHIRVQVLEV